jgi:outer membrane lipoprotein-sorting protein
MLRGTSIAVLASALVLAAPVLGADAGLEATLAKMDQTARTFKDLTANLKRTHHTAVIDENTEDKGTIYIRRPKPNELLMKVDIKEPDPKQVAVGARTAMLYIPKSNTVDIYDIVKYKKEADQLLLLGFGTTSQEMEDSYRIALGGPETLNGQKTTRLELTPKANEMHLEKVELWISDTTGLPVQQKLHWPGPNGGDYDLATYSNMQVNTGLPESAVTLQLPKGVKKEYPQR